MTQEDGINDILRLGIQAPSGENSQPWRFRREQRGDVERVWLYNRPEADTSVYNYGQGGSYIAHGALLENIVIAAEVIGWRAEIQLFPSMDSREKDLVAIIDFKRIEPDAERRKDPLFDAIERRATNRKKYDALPLHEPEKKALLAANNSEGVRLFLIEDREKIAKIAKAASINEMMLVENRYVHDFFFNHVRWTSEENELQPDGFYIKTLELKPQQEKGFGLLKKWGAARLLAKIGMSRAVGRDNEAIYNSASAMIAVVIKNNEPQNLVLAGRAFERAWLTATQLGLSVQPTSGALFLAQGINAENKEKFSASQRERLLAAQKAFYEVFEIGVNEEQNGYIAVVFRVGHGGEPTAHAARFPLEMFFLPSLIKSENKMIQLAANRQEMIDHILADLETLHGNPALANQYAIEENIAFFKAIRSVPSYMRWLIRRAPKLDRARLLELTDLPFPRWDREMHLKLMEVESREFPGLVAPLANRLWELIEMHGRDQSAAGRPFIGLHLGSGGREVDRQVIRKLIGKKYQGQVVLIGVDTSSVANELARDNFRELEPFITIREIDMLDPASLKEILASEKKRHIVIFAKNNIFDLPKQFNRDTFDVIYHTLFKHHLPATQKEQLDSTVAPLGKHMLEYDGYKSWGVIIPQTLTGWKHPPFMNAELFSNFRFLEKREIKACSNNVIFYPRVGAYLMVN